MQNNALVKLDNAISWLAKVENLNEVKEIIDIAEAARVYAQAAKKGLKAQNRATEIKLRAERKAGEILSQLEKGKGNQYTKVELSGQESSTSEYREALQENEIPDTTAAKWQIEASIPEEKFEEHIAKVTESGGELTTAGLLKETKVPHVSHNSGENEWYTPIEYIARARIVMGNIDLDPASSKIANKTVEAKKFYSKEDNGLTKRWLGRVWMNPPYASDLISKFVSKYVEHVKNKDITEGIVLVNNATETSWFKELTEVSKAIVFPKGRVKFLDPNGNPGAPLQGQAVVYTGENMDTFINEFSDFGWAVAIC